MANLEGWKIYGTRPEPWGHHRYEIAPILRAVINKRSRNFGCILGRFVYRKVDLDKGYPGRLMLEDRHRKGDPTITETSHFGDGEA
jgi:hypothetical protein